jgi:hypothetical protein
VLHPNFMPLLLLCVSRRSGPRQSLCFLSDATAGCCESSAGVLYRFTEEVSHILSDLSKAKPTDVAAGWVLCLLRSSVVITS